MASITLILFSRQSKWTQCRGEELLDLIQKPTAKETATVKRFKTEGGPAVREYCPHLTKDDCSRSAHCLTSFSTAARNS